MNKYNTHSDLAKESLELLKEGKHYKRFIEKMDNVVLQTVIFILALFVGIAWVEFEHNITIYKILILYFQLNEHDI